MWKLEDGFRPHDTCREIKITGRITTDLDTYFSRSIFDLVDISGAEFIEEDKEVRLDYKVIVTDDCPLFSMRDGDVYNKKGTIPIYNNK